MRTRALRLLLPAAVALLCVAGAAFGPCVEHRALEEGLAGFDVRVTAVSGAAGGDGTVESPYDMPAGETTFTIEAFAYDRRGQPFPFTGQASVRITPGMLSNPGQRVSLQDGKVIGAQVRARDVFGRVSIWLQDVDWVDAPPVQGTLMEVAQVQPVGSWAMGISKPVYFRNPTLHQIQFSDWIYQGGAGGNDFPALDRVFAEIDCWADRPCQWPDGHGQLVVTGIFNEGFFVTDVCGAAEGYNHLYSYSYSYPENLEIGDRLDRLVGTTQDFSGCTQIGFPAWTRATDENHDPIPFRVNDLDALLPPTLIDTALCNLVGTSNLHLCGYSKQNWTLEDLESARVRLENVRTPNVLIDCDFNANGEITFSYPSPDEETDCSESCLARDGAVITAKKVITSPAVLQAIAVNTCTAAVDCATGQCGGYSEADATDGVCRVICPWEAAIPGIRPNCIQVHIGTGQVCTELSTLEQFGQWVVALDDGAGPLINVLTRESLVNFDPADPANLGLTVPFFQGNLRQVRAARPRWIVLVGTLPGDAPESMRQ